MATACGDDSSSEHHDVKVDCQQVNTPVASTQNGNGSNSPLTLSKKGSWMGSIRSAIQKQALGVKSAADALRGGIRGSQESKVDENEHLESPEARPSPDMQRPQHRRATSAKLAMASLRKHIPQGLQNEQKSLRQQTGSPECTNQSGGAAPLDHHADHLAFRVSPRRNLAQSISGSLKRFRRRALLPKPSLNGLPDPEPPEHIQETYTESASDVDETEEYPPLPSSQIQIPPAPPRLGQLDFGDSAFADSDLSISPEKRFRKQVAQAAGLEMSPRKREEALTDIEPTVPDPPSPMPGTTLSLEVDSIVGTTNGYSPTGPATHDPSETASLFRHALKETRSHPSRNPSVVFERGIEEPAHAVDPKVRGARRMRSLGAMCEDASLVVVTGLPAKPEAALDPQQARGLDDYPAPSESLTTLPDRVGVDTIPQSLSGLVELSDRRDEIEAPVSGCQKSPGQSKRGKLPPLALPPGFLFSQQTQDDNMNPCTASTTAGQSQSATRPLSAASPDMFVEKEPTELPEERVSSHADADFTAPSAATSQHCPSKMDTSLSSHEAVPHSQSITTDTNFFTDGSEDKQVLQSDQMGCDTVFPSGMLDDSVVSPFKPHEKLYMTSYHESGSTSPRSFEFAQSAHSGPSLVGGRDLDLTSLLSWGGSSDGVPLDPASRYDFTVPTNSLPSPRPSSKMTHLDDDPEAPALGVQNDPGQREQSETGKTTSIFKAIMEQGKSHVIVATSKVSDYAPVTQYEGDSPENESPGICYDLFNASYDYNLESAFMPYSYGEPQHERPETNPEDAGLGLSFRQGTNSVGMVSFDSIMMMPADADDRVNTPDRSLGSNNPFRRNNAYPRRTCGNQSEIESQLISCEQQGGNSGPPLLSAELTSDVAQGEETSVSCTLTEDNLH